MNDILYKNALYFKKEILPYTFILELKKELIIIKAQEQDFAHLVGKQYSKNLEIKSISQKEFFEQSLSQKITLKKLLDFDKNTYRNEFNWIINKNNSFINAFDSFVRDTNLKMYQMIGKEIYTKLNIDYFHQKDNLDISVIILGIIGNSRDDTFLFNTILSNDETLRDRFNKCQKIKIHQFYKVLNKNLNVKLFDFNKEVKKSPNNINSISIKRKSNKKEILTNTDLKEINKLLTTSLHILRGMNGKKSIKITKNGQIIEKGIKLNLKEFDSNKKIAQYINDKYK